MDHNTEIFVLMAQFPSREIAQRSYNFRTLGLGYANIGGLLMNMGLGYDSDEGRSLCGALTAIMTCSYSTSATMASEVGAFPGYSKIEPYAQSDKKSQKRSKRQKDGYELKDKARAIRPPELSRSDFDKKKH